MIRSKITPFLWFDKQAEEAARFYCSLFPNSRILETTHFPEGHPGPVGKVMTVRFELDGLPLIALNGGPHYQLTEAFSLAVDCESQAEVDRLWDAFMAEGTPLQCGWLKDKYGLTWQIVPAPLVRLMTSGTPAQSQRVMQAMFKMIKLDLPTLQAAFDG